MTDHLSASVGRKEKETEPMHFVFRVWGSEGGPRRPERGAAQAREQPWKPSEGRCGRSEPGGGLRPGPGRFESGGGVPGASCLQPSGTLMIKVQLIIFKASSVF